MSEVDKRIEELFQQDYFHEQPTKTFAYCSHRCFTALLLCAWTAPSLAGTSDPLQGLWVGTDPSDGGLQTWIIARKGTAYQVRVNDTYLRTCAGNRGSFLGKGFLDQDGNLNAEMKIQCLADPTNEPYLKPVSLNFSFKWNAHGYLEATTTSGVTQQATTLFKIADKTVCY